MIRRLQASGDDPFEAVRGLEGEVDPAELAELERVLGMLATAGSTERRTVLDTADAPSVLSAEEVAALSRQATGTASVGFPTRAWATAAALLILALAVGRFAGNELATEGPVLDPGPTLGSSLRALTPVGEASYEHFEWEAPALPGGWFEVIVYDASDPSRPIDRSPELEESSWTPIKAETWPNAILWELVAYDFDGIPTDSERFAASRAPR